MAGNLIVFISTSIVALSFIAHAIGLIRRGANGGGSLEKTARIASTLLLDRSQRVPVRQD